MGLKLSCLKGRLGWVLGSLLLCEGIWGMVVHGGALGISAVGRTGAVWHPGGI